MLLSVVLTCSVARADEAIPLAHPQTGVSGVWLPLDMARLCLEAERVVPMREQQIATLTERLTLRLLEAARFRLAAVNAQDALRDARAELTAWWRSPVLWFGIGSALGAGVILALAGAL